MPNRVDMISRIMIAALIAVVTALSGAAFTLHDRRIEKLEALEVVQAREIGDLRAKDDISMLERRQLQEENARLNREVSRMMGALAVHDAKLASVLFEIAK